MVVMDCSLKRPEYLAGFFSPPFSNPDQVGSVKGELLEGMAQQKGLSQTSLMHLSKQRGTELAGAQPYLFIIG